MVCEQCHLVPTAFGDPGHMDTALPAEVLWDSTDLARADQANPSWGGTTCTGVYCHGSTLMGTGANKTPTWTTLDGSQKACGTACHTLPPGGTHPTSTACPTCHGAVIATFTGGGTPSATWTDPNKHVNGIVEYTASLSCTSCHGNSTTNDPAPPLGTKGETLTSQNAVGAHQQHLAVANWHKQVVCTDCHNVPTSTTHSNGSDDFAFSALAKSDGANPSYDGTSFTCTGAYCHGSTLLGPNTGGSIKTSPVWTTVDGSYDACGSSCHTNPPGGTHPAKANCPSCHGAVLSSYVPGTPAQNVWADAQKHVNGIVETSMTCVSCHGTSPSQVNPPMGVGGETTTNTLAVGRHVAHLTASSTHVAFACGTCHTVPPSGDVAHAAQYVASANLSTAGHHGDVTFSAPATGMVWNVNATQGAPVTARGTCTGSCHSDGRGGPPNVTPYWAGGAWTAGSCTSCHDATMNTLTNRHPKHDGEAVCGDCHPPASGSTHMNGTWNVNSVVNGSSGGSVTTSPPGGVCGTNYACNGTCHGKDHNNRCWN
ncbi:MAG: CxxxxCH/CxxCH domain-containing protein [Sorangiineae bacterium PRO1]|nr:CxxxxCH/CxxCH domain-containing protein [Sorangiineae bacterium PRO1]